MRRLPRSAAWATGVSFSRSGLYVRNPIIPAAVLLAWEGANGIFPHVLQKMSILYYLQSLCPVPAPMDDDAPTLIRLLAAPAAPASRPGAILGLLLLTAFVLWIASLAVRRMEISYGGDADGFELDRALSRLEARDRFVMAAVPSSGGIGTTLGDVIADPASVSEASPL